MMFHSAGYQAPKQTHWPENGEELAARLSALGYCRPWRVMRPEVAAVCAPKARFVIFRDDGPGTTPELFLFVLQESPADDYQPWVFEWHKGKTYFAERARTLDTLMEKTPVQLAIWAPPIA